MKTKLFFSMLTAAAALAVAPATFADEGSVEVNYEYTIPYLRGSYTSSNGFTGIGITVDGTVSDFTLTGSEGSDISNKSVVFIGANGNDSITITSASIDNGDYKGGYDETTDVFAVEGCTVIIDGSNGLEINDLGMSLVVGTMYQAGDAELVITNGAKVTTGARYNVVGSNLNTGTITISDNSTLATQQITLGGGVSSLFDSGDPNGSYQTKWFYDDSTYTETIRAKLVSGESLYGISYGIVNVESGSTFSVGVSDTNHYENKFQLSNGELNVDGKGSQMIIGSNSEFLLMGEWAFSTGNGESPLYTGICYTEKITVTNGGKITNEVDADGNSTGLYALYIGEDFLAANTTVEISVSGSDGEDTTSSFDLTSSNSAHIGAKSGYDTTYQSSYGASGIIKDGGTMDVTINADDGGEFKITANGIYVCADNYETYLIEGGDQKDVGHSYGIDVKLSATDGGSLELNAENGSTVLLAAGSPKTEEGTDGENAYTNTLTINADGEGSSVKISGGDIYTNFGNDGTGGADNVYVTITAKNGGTIALSAETVDGKGDGVISFGKNTAITVDNGSSLTAKGTVKFEAGSSLTISVVADVATKLAADTPVNVSLGEVTIAEGASVYVVIDVSSLEAGDQATVAVLQAESVTLDSSTLSNGEDVTSYVTDYFTADEKGYTLDSWSYLSNDDGTNTLYANITATPEPSMFGLFAGLMAVGLVSTRRRRRKA